MEQYRFSPIPIELPFSFFFPSFFFSLLIRRCERRKKSVSLLESLPFFLPFCLPPGKREEGEEDFGGTCVPLPAGSLPFSPFFLHSGEMKGRDCEADEAPPRVHVFFPFVVNPAMASLPFGLREEASFPIYPFHHAPFFPFLVGSRDFPSSPSGPFPFLFYLAGADKEGCLPGLPLFPPMFLFFPHRTSDNIAETGDCPFFPFLPFFFPPPTVWLKKGLSPIPSVQLPPSSVFFSFPAVTDLCT